MAHHQQLLDWIENELVNQTLHLGDELPDDKELTQRVGMSHNHVRESLKHCEEIGVLKLYEGRKKSIIGVLVREPAISAGPAIGLYLAGSRSPRQDLLTTCLLLENFALAGPEYDSTAFVELDRILDELQEHAGSLTDFHEREADFHIQLGRLSGNPLISALLATLRDAMIEARFELVSQVPLWSATATRLVMEYRAITDAARSGDPALAQTLLRATLQDRFTEAGHPLHLEEPQQGDLTDAQFTLKPLDAELLELATGAQGGSLDPHLYQALFTIQPKDASADSQPQDAQAHGTSAPEEDCASEQSPSEQSPEAPSSPALQPSPAESRKFPGTVGPAVRAVTTPPVPTAQLSSAEAADSASDQQSLEAKLRAEEERLDALEASASSGAKDAAGDPPVTHPVREKTEKADTSSGEQGPPHGAKAQKRTSSWSRIKRFDPVKYFGFSQQNQRPSQDKIGQAQAGEGAPDSPADDEPVETADLLEAVGAEQPSPPAESLSALREGYEYAHDEQASGSNPLDDGNSDGLEPATTTPLAREQEPQSKALVKKSSRRKKRRR
ncbi:FadR/GntR family transcriptional regulator [Rothia nasisuis]|uniref:FadR/GntR family transcriptional regulator n=1 Tax=Rothia nasisuis TaxID=2109647 RepID=UPI001F1B9097|nr:FCD domain-containing protein [Rothia nasisuis]